MTEIVNNTPKRSIDETESTKEEKHFKDGLGSVVAKHYNSIQESGLERRDKSSIVYMRNFNNWIKSILISKSMRRAKQQLSEHKEIVVLDIGCGKGGDLLKWDKANISHYIAADIADVSVVQCQQRYKENNRRHRFSAEFIVADCTKVKLRPHMSDPNRQVHIVSCQFAFHYCFESLAQAETMISNISESLIPGGIFIGTTTHEYHIMKLVNQNDGRSYKSDILRITFPEDRTSPPPLFGDTYDFYLDGAVDCPEFLVHFPTLIKLCDKYDLQLIYDRNFGDMYKDSKADNLDLLFRMRALKRVSYPSSSVEFSHINEFCKNRDLREACTISQPEWDAICLYRGFAFQKKTKEQLSKTDG